MKRFRLSRMSGYALLAGCVVLSANADNLMQVYAQAAQSDPTFAQAESNWRAQKMNLPIAQAGYLPQVNIVANADRDYTQIYPNLLGAPNTSSSTSSTGGASSISAPGESWQYGSGLVLTQPIFNFAVWKKITGADAAVKSATATFLAAQQSLMQRTAQAYFNVLQAYDQLRYTIANKRAVWQQYVTAREQFRVGLIAITDEYDARASYDQVVAQQIAAQNNLNIQLENLRAITGRSYTALSRLGKRLPLITPQPNNMEQWVAVANKQNYSIKAQNYAVISAMENIKQQAAGGYPVLSFQGGASANGTEASSFNNTVTQENVGLQLAYNPIQGGLVRASTKQAHYQYVTAAGLLEQTHRQVVNQARSSFLSVLSYVSQIKADKATIESSRNSALATEAGLKVGTRTMVDVLQALTTLYQAQEEYANDQYAYINNLIALKSAAGTLNVDDLRQINSWLGKAVVFPAQTSVATVPSENTKPVINPKELDTVNPPPLPAALQSAPNVAPNFKPLSQDASLPLPGVQVHAHAQTAQLQLPAPA